MDKISIRTGIKTIKQLHQSSDDNDSAAVSFANLPVRVKSSNSAINYEFLPGEGKCCTNTILKEPAR
jgi:hypothetical protein